MPTSVGLFLRPYPVFRSQLPKCGATLACAGALSRAVQRMQVLLGVRGVSYRSSLSNTIGRTAAQASVSGLGI
jgi:hypothetical protein